MPDSSPANMSPELEQRAQGGADELLDVVLELQQDAPGDDSADALREQFSHTKAPVAEAISQLGGTVTDEAWINATMRARVPVRALKALADLDAVRAMDVPHRITPD